MKMFGAIVFLLVSSSNFIFASSKGKQNERKSKRQSLLFFEHIFSRDRHLCLQMKLVLFFSVSFEFRPSKVEMKNKKSSIKSTEERREKKKTREERKMFCFHHLSLSRKVRSSRLDVVSLTHSMEVKSNRCQSIFILNTFLEQHRRFVFSLVRFISIEKF